MERVMLTMKELNEYIKQTINLTKKGYDVKGIGKTPDGELSLLIHGPEDMDLLNLEIDMNT